MSNFIDVLLNDATVDFDKAIDLCSDWEPTEKEYRDYPALNFHTLNDFRRDPRAWKEGLIGSPLESDSMRFGTALHAKILEGDDVYNNKVATFKEPVNPKTGKPFGATTKAYEDAFFEFMRDSEDKTIIGEEDAKTIETLYESYCFHNVAPSILGETGFRHTEMSVKGFITIDDAKVEVKGRIDCYGANGLVDVKTTKELSDATGRDKFLRSIYEYKYIVQLGFYHLLLTECLDAPFVPAWIVAFERQKPNRIGVYRLTPEVVKGARETALNWIRQYVEARDSGIYESPFDSVTTIDRYDPSRDA